MCRFEIFNMTEGKCHRFNGEGYSTTELFFQRRSLAVPNGA
jgi:hypothetical protein